MARNLVTILIVLVVGSLPAILSTDDGNGKCGFKACHPVKEGMINVHLVSHTHDDVGWVQTMDVYFDEVVRDIISSVVRELLTDPARRFVYVESAFFWMWWRLQNDHVRQQVRNLVNEGRLEFIGGGWTMNDEAVTHYQSVIDQLTWGLRFLNDTFGPCGRPRVAWQIDPFGHSREMASIFAHMGYDGLFFARLDFQDKKRRQDTNTAEMVWQASANLGKSAELFTHALYSHYSPPPGFCFDSFCDDIPLTVDETRSHKIEEFIEQAKRQAHMYRSENIIMTMGSDFHYSKAHKWYTNLDILISEVNKLQSGVNVFYSTPSCYLKAVNDKYITWPTKKDDFFPYGSGPQTYWTGYYSSRPTIKYFERLGNNFLQVCKQMSTLTHLRPEYKIYLSALREAMAVMQHHDAITGTEKQHVAADYCRLLTEGLNECEIIANTAVNKLTRKKKEVNEPIWQSCFQLNISQCAPTEESKRFVVTVYNPLSRVISPYVRFPVNGSAYTVEDYSGKIIENQLMPIPKPVQRIPGRRSNAVNELIFRAEHLPPMSFHSYFVTKTTEEEENTYISEEMPISTMLGHNDFHFLANEEGDFETLFARGVEFQFSEEYAFYGTNSSGAYIFNPQDTATSIPLNYRRNVYQGPLVTERHDTFRSWVSQVVRVYSGEQHAEIEWLVGPIPVRDKLSKEVIVKYSTDIQSGGKFYTDSNGREMMERTRNSRPTWDLQDGDRVGGNYYPVTNRILLRDPKRRLELAVITDRAQGGSSLADGQLELMLHRRLLKDDGLGVEEPLNEVAFQKGVVTRGKHYLTGGSSNRSLPLYERMLAQEKLLQPWLLFSSADEYTFETWSKNFLMQARGVENPLPNNVHILTLEPWKGRSLLLRLEHILEKNEDPELSKPVTVNLQKIFVPFEITRARETTLGANQWLADSKRLKWRYESKRVSRGATSFARHNYTESVFHVTLFPMQIRTFVISVQYGKK